MSDTTPIEAPLIRVINAVRHKFDATLKRRGLRIEPPKVSVLRPAPESYTSEIRIDIIRLDTRQIVDCLEFFAFEEGKPQLTDEDLLVWMVDQVSALTKEEGKRGEATFRLGGSD